MGVQVDAIKVLQLPYATCGSLDRSSGLMLRNLAAGKILRVGMLSNSGGFKGSYHPEGNTIPPQRDNRWTGPTTELVFEAARRAGAIINITRAPEWVYKNLNSTSKFTQCLYAVELGYLDMCIGRISFTDTRTSADNADDALGLRAHAHGAATRKDKNALDKFMSALRPFDWNVWLLCILVLMGTPVVMLFQDSVDEYLKGRKTDPGLSVKTNLVGIYGGLRTFTDSGAYHEPTSWGGRITSLALGLFVVLVISSYTSNLTSILVMKSSKVRFETFEQAVEQGVPVCVIPNRVENVLNAYPKAVVALGPSGENPVQRRDDVFALVEQEKCQVGLAYLEDLQQYIWQNGDGAYSGRLTRSGDPVMYGLTGIPIADTPVAHAMQYRLQSLLNSGYYEDLKKKATPPTSMLAPEAVDTVSFSMEDMAGIFAITGVIAALGLIISVIDGIRKCQRRNRKGADDSAHEDGPVVLDEPSFLAARERLSRAPTRTFESGVGMVSMRSYRHSDNSTIYSNSELTSGPRRRSIAVEDGMLRARATEPKISETEAFC